MPRPDGPQFSDPTLFQGVCFTCGHPIRSQSFSTYSPMSRYTYGEKGQEGNIAGTVVHPEKAVNNGVRSWEHYPRGRDFKAFSNIEHGVEHMDGIYPDDSRTHEQDWERQHREWKAQQAVDMHNFTKDVFKELE